eukprot:Gb_00237 [translate_table: standard]
MADFSQCLFLNFVLILCFITSLISLAGARNAKIFSQMDPGQRLWCVAKPSADDNSLSANLNYACSQGGVDCSVLHNGCPCYYPNTLISHASVAMNLYYQAHGRNFWNCYFNSTGLVVFTDPSFGKCIYPSQ